MRCLTKNNNEIRLIGSGAKGGKGGKCNGFYPAEDNGKVLVVGVFHGDEPQGKFLIEDYLAKNPDSPHLFIPCLNPDGLAAGTRTNAAGVDLNRNFPGTNWECGAQNEFWGGSVPASEIETRFLIEVIEKHRPRLILTLHAPFKVVNYDGPARETAQKISQITGYPVQENIGYPTPGSFGTWAGAERNIPVITLELDEECPVQNLIEPFYKVLLSIS